MNRKVLHGITVGDGHSYANDALQNICSKLFPYDMRIILKWVDDNTIGYDDRPEEYHKAVKNIDNTIALFNSVVSQGKEFALDFINNNHNLWR